MGVAVAKVFATEELAKSAKTEKERVFKLTRSDASVVFVACKDANDARIKLTKYDQVQVAVTDTPPPADKVDALSKRLNKMSPEELLRLRQLLEAKS